MFHIISSFSWNICAILRNSFFDWGCYLCPFGLTMRFCNESHQTVYLVEPSCKRNCVFGLLNSLQSFWNRVRDLIDDFLALFLCWSFNLRVWRFFSIFFWSCCSIFIEINSYWAFASWFLIESWFESSLVRRSIVDSSTVSVFHWELSSGWGPSLSTTHWLIFTLFSQEHMHLRDPLTSCFFILIWTPPHPIFFEKRWKQKQNDWIPAQRPVVLFTLCFTGTKLQ